MSGTAKTAAAIAAAVAVLAVSWLVFEGDSGPAGPAGSSGLEHRRVETKRFTISSRAVPGGHPAVMVVPKEGGSERDGSARERGLLVFLHGLGGDEETHAEHEAFVEALARVDDATGGRAPVVIFPRGESSFWHDRRTGRWGRYVTDEVIPQAAKRAGVDPRLVAVGGISMGGFGALNLGQKHPGRFCAVGGHSPGIFGSFEEALPVAFDDRRDFRANDVIGAATRDPFLFGRTPVWLDAGTSDYFHPATLRLATILASAEGVTPDADRKQGTGHLTSHLSWPGGHDGAYWDAHWSDYLDFYAAALRKCDPVAG